MSEPLTARVFKKRNRYVWSCDACQEMMPGRRLRSERTAAIAAALHNVTHGDSRLAFALGKLDPVRIIGASCPKHGPVAAAEGFEAQVMWRTLLRSLPLEVPRDELGGDGARCPRCDAGLALTIGGRDA